MTTQTDQEAQAQMETALYADAPARAPESEAHGALMAAAQAADQKEAASQQETIYQARARRELAQLNADRAKGALIAGLMAARQIHGLNKWDPINVQMLEAVIGLEGKISEQVK